VMLASMAHSGYFGSLFRAIAAPSKERFNWHDLLAGWSTMPRVYQILLSMFAVWILCICVGGLTIASLS